MKPSKRTTEPTARSVATRPPFVCLDVDGGPLDLGRLHLRSGGTLPDQLVEARLIRIEILAQLARGAGEVCRTNRFMRLLAHSWP